MNSEDIGAGGHNYRQFYARTWRWLKDRSTIITFFFFNIILTTADVGTDVWTAIQLIRYDVFVCQIVTDFQSVKNIQQRQPPTVGSDNSNPDFLAKFGHGSDLLWKNVDFKDIRI